MILSEQIHYSGHWKGGRQKSRAFLGSKNSRFSVPIPSNDSSNGCARIKIINYKRHIKSKYIGNFMYMSFVPESMSFCILLSVCCDFYVHVQGPTLLPPPPPLTGAK
jgi:hypothetical protein